MSSESIKNNDPVQLKQMIIFLRAELTKYEHKVKEYKDSYHYSVIENLEQENAQLIKENNELSKRIHEMQRRNYSPSVDFVWKTKTDWLPVNKQLNEVMKILKDNAEADQVRHRKQERQITSLHKKLIDQKSRLEQVEFRLVDHFQKVANQVQTRLENVSITHDERLRFEEGKGRLRKKIEEKNNKIEELQHEIVELKEQKKMSKDSLTTAVLKSESAKTSETLLKLEHQLKDVLTKSLDSEKKWEAKLATFEDLKQHFLKEIEEKNNKIEELQLEIMDMKEQKKMAEDNMPTVVSKSESACTPEMLLLLERQIKEVLVKTLNYEEKLDAKLDVLNDLEHKLDQLTVEIDDIKEHDAADENIN